MCTCTASNFTMLPSPDQWQDLNHCKRFGSMEKVPLKMYQLDRRYPERLAIGMAPWLTFTKMWIIDTDYENYSLVGDPSRKVPPRESECEGGMPCDHSFCLLARHSGSMAGSLAWHTECMPTSPRGPRTSVSTSAS